MGRAHRTPRRHGTESEQAAAKALEEGLQKLQPDDKAFAMSLLAQLHEKMGLTDKQWPHVLKLASRIGPDDGVPDFTKRIEVGDFKGVIALFAEAKKQVKHPKIRVALPLDGEPDPHTLVKPCQPLAITVAGNASKRPGCVNVTDGGRYGENKWFGRVTPEGTWERSDSTSPELMVPLMGFLSELAADPAKTASAYGKMTGVCMFCSIPLTDPKSKSVGYGPVCAKHWGLPWGEVSGVFTKVA